MSIGLRRLQLGGNTWSNRSIVSGDSSAKSPPPETTSSAANTPGPPALVSTINLRPRGRGCLASTSVMSNRSSIVSTRNTPDRRKAASNTASLPDSDPVWEAAAWAAASVRPTLITMIGFCSATSRAADRKARASPTDSM